MGRGSLTFLVICFLMILSMLPKVTYCAIGETSFTDVSDSAGINVIRQTWGNPIWGDFDGDGNLDILVVNHYLYLPSLFHNNDDGTFTDVIQQSGIASTGDAHGSAWGDYDNDGNTDLFITIGAARGKTVGSKKDQLYHNDGYGHFTDVTDIAGVANELGRGRSVNWVDFNNDGHLDLFVKNYKTKNVLYQNKGDGTFTDVASSAGIAAAPGEISSWADYDNDGDMDLFITGVSTNDQLWANNGNGTFSEKTSEAGLIAKSHGQGIAWGDYNNDGYLDLYITRGFNDIRDSLSWDASSIIFSDQETKSQGGLNFITSGNQVTFDLYLANCHQPTKVFIGSQKNLPAVIPFTLTNLDAAGKPYYLAGRALGFFIWKDGNGWHIRWSSSSTKYFYGKITSNGQFQSVRPVNFKRHNPSVTSTLYRNNGDGTFTDVTEQAGVGTQTNNRAAVWGDYNNDGYLDLYVVNSGSFRGNGLNILYRNNGDGTFTNVAEQAGVTADVQGRGDGAAWGDFNNDGFLDLYVTNGWGLPVVIEEGSQCLAYGPHILYKNNGNTNRWLKINNLQSN